MTVGDHINIHGSMISYNIVKNKIKFKCTWVHKNDQNVLYALSSNYLSDKRRGKIRPRSRPSKNSGTATGNSSSWIGMASRRPWEPRLASAPASRGVRLRGKLLRAPVMPPQRSPDTAPRRAPP